MSSTSFRHRRIQSWPRTAGMRTVAFCEIDARARKSREALAGRPIFEDVRTIDHAEAMPILSAWVPMPRH